VCMHQISAFHRATLTDLLVVHAQGLADMVRILVTP
jgi:hypothetical protein